MKHVPWKDQKEALKYTMWINGQVLVAKHCKQISNKQREKEKEKEKDAQYYLH